MDFGDVGDSGRRAAARVDEWLGPGNARIEEARMELPSAANGATCHHFVVDEPTIASLMFGRRQGSLHVLIHCFPTCLPGSDDKKESLCAASPVPLPGAIHCSYSPWTLLARLHTIASGCCKPPLTLLVGSTRPRPLPPINRSCAAEAATMSSPIAYLQ